MKQVFYMLISLGGVHRLHFFLDVKSTCQKYITSFFRGPKTSYNKIQLPTHLKKKLNLEGCSDYYIG